MKVEHIVISVINRKNLKSNRSMIQSIDIISYIYVYKVHNIIQYCFNSTLGPNYVIICVRYALITGELSNVEYRVVQQL